jgi:hypothetical protein
MALLQIEAPMTPDELAGILAAGSLVVRDDKARQIARAISQAGATYIRAVMARNEPDPMALWQRLQLASPALDTVIDALGPPSLASGSDMSPSGVLADPRYHIYQELRAHIRRARGVAGDAAPPVDEVTKLLESIVQLRDILNEATRRLVREISSLPRSSEARPGTARALIGRTPTHMGPRSDIALNHFLLSVWEIHFKATRRLPKTSLRASLHDNKGRASGPFIQFCRACLTWANARIPPELAAIDPRVRKARRMTGGAIRVRLQKAMDFGTMRHG